MTEKSPFTITKTVIEKQLDSQRPGKFLRMMTTLYTTIRNHKIDAYSPLRFCSTLKVLALRPLFGTK